MKTKGGPLENTYEYTDHIFKEFQTKPLSFFIQVTFLYYCCVSAILLIIF